MSFYRNLLVAVAAMGLAGAVFAEDAATTTSSTTATTASQPADASSAASTTSADASSSAAATTEKVDINTATAKQLTKVKGLGSARAKAIVKYRKDHGSFKSLDELKEVKGFKKLNDQKMQEITDQLTISG